MTRAHARRTDPQTSHDAAAGVVPHITDLELVVLAALILRGPSTAHDIAEFTERSLVTISPRLRPLEERGMVVRVGRAGRRSLWDVTAKAVWTTTGEQAHAR
jgi:DNA-binding MarR family transcriptional regulator